LQLAWAKKPTCMKQTVLIMFTLFIFSVSPYCQVITGTWYSKDRTRTYTISKKGEQLEAILTASSRNTDKPGKVILSQVNRKGDSYKGIISAPSEEINTLVKMKYSRRRKDTLRLKLKRMFFLDVIIRWYRNPLRAG
jgi:uncharacterized protein (DUF2147 family)